MKKLVFLLTCLLVGMGVATAQTRAITGTVIDEGDGQPVIGASVSVQGAKLGTVTDIDGKFTFPRVPASAKTLKISYIGMQTQEVFIQPTMRVVLKSDSKVLDEVIVVAYGTAKKSAFTGSASVVKSEELNKVQNSNVLNALTGKVTGMQMTSSSGQPGTGATVRIRGVSSINAGNDPLIILDGIPYDGSLSNLSTQDIESVTVLKDAASNALYGARGANGVIMVTTKKGTSGSAKVTVDAKWGVDTRATQDYKLVKDPAQYYEMHYSALNNYYKNGLGYSNEQAYKMANQNLTATNDYGLGYNVYTVPQGENLIGTNGKLNPNATLGRIASNNGRDYLLTPDDWMDATYKTSLRQEYNLNASAGSDQGSFFLSVNYLKDGGITDKSDYERFTGRLKADYQLKPWLKMGANMAYAHYSSNSVSNAVFAAATSIAPIYPLYIRDAQGHVIPDGNNFRMYDYGDGGNAGLQRPVQSNSNALSDNLLNTSGSEGNNTQVSGFAEIRFLKNFKFTSTNSANVNESRTTGVINPYYGPQAVLNGIVSKDHGRSYAYNFQQLLNYGVSLGSNNISAMVGHESYRYKYYSLHGDKSNMFDPANHELSGAVINGVPDSYKTDYNTEGYFFRGQYDYAGKYFGSVSFRRDASSRFHPDHRWGNFWSVGAAWNIYKESWFKVKWVDVLKLKASYGEQGNDAIGDYRYVDTYTIANASGHAAAVPSLKGNKDITWEKNGNFNAGIEFELLGHRLNGTFEYFYRKTSDMLFAFPLPPSRGYTSYYANVGDMRNQGVEADLTGTAIQTKDLKWDLHLNITHIKNKITSLPEERKSLTSSEGVQGYTSGNVFYGEGISLYTVYMPKYAGVSSDGQAMYYRDITDKNGRITGRETTTEYSTATDYLCGTTLPDAFGGFGTSLKYKNFDVSVDFAYQIGGQVYDAGYAMAMSVPSASTKGGAFHADLLKAWTPENPTSNVPRLQYGDQYVSSGSDRFLTNASYLSLQNINAGYTFPNRIMKHLGVDKLRLYVVCDNVWLWSKRQGLDPRQSIAGSNSASVYSPIRTISGGLTLTF